MRNEEAQNDAQKDAGQEVTDKQDTPKIRKFRANGEEFEFTDEEIMSQFETVFGKAMNYTQKMQAIAPYRKMISALESEGITQDQLNIAIDALKGDKGALQKMLKDSKIDPYELQEKDENATPYTPTAYGKTEQQLEIEEITSSIEKDPEFKVTVDVIDRQWDPESRAKIAQNPTMILGLHNDIKSGLYDELAPIARKMQVLDGNSKSALEYYLLAGDQRNQRAKATAATEQVSELNKATQEANAKFEEASSEAHRKRSASTTSTRAGRKGVVDYLDDDDEAFDNWYKNLMSNN